MQKQGEVWVGLCRPKSRSGTFRNQCFKNHIVRFLLDAATASCAQICLGSNVAAPWQKPLKSKTRNICLHACH